MRGKVSRLSFWLLVVAGALMILWGISHIAPTRMVMRGMGVIDPDSLTIITMEWVAAGITFIFLGVLLVFLAPYVGVGNNLARWVTLITVVMLVVLAILSGATGAQTDQSVFYKICPFVESTAALLALVAAWVRTGSKNTGVADV